MREELMVKPVILEYEDGKSYKLEFSRATAVMAEEDGFKIFDVQDKLLTRTPQLFYWAFQKNHPEITREEADRILEDDLGGMNEDLMERLVELYSVPYNAILTEDKTPKNSKLTVKL